MFQLSVIWDGRPPRPDTACCRTWNIFFLLFNAWIFFFSFYFLFCGRDPSQVTHPTPTTKTNPQPTNTMSTQLENLTRETSTPLHQLLSDKKIKKRLHWKCGTAVQSPFYENDPLDAKLSWIQQKILTHMAKYTLSLWQNVHSRQQDFLFFPGWKIALWCWNVWSKRNSQLMCSALTTGWRNCI